MQRVADNFGLTPASGPALEKRIEVGFAILHKPADFYIGNVVTPSAAPDTQSVFGDVEIVRRFRGLE
jgi:hypothetical protein